MASAPLGNFGHVVVSVSINFPSNSWQDALFHLIACDYSRADCDGLRDHLRDVTLEDIFKVSASAASSEFCEWVQIGIDVYIPHRKYQVKLHSSPWFSAACAAAIVHKNHFFRFYQKDKYSDSEVKFKQASNRWEGFLKLPNLHMLIKQSLLLPRNLALVTFWQIANGILNKGKSPKPLLFNGPEVLSSSSDIAELFT